MLREEDSYVENAEKLEVRVSDGALEYVAAAISKKVITIFNNQLTVFISFRLVLRHSL